MGAHPLFSALSRRGLNRIKLAYSPSPPDNGLGQYVSSPGNRAYCYAELAVSSLAMAVITTSTHFAYPRRDGQAELAWMAGYIPATEQTAYYCVIVLASRLHRRIL